MPELAVIIAAVNEMPQLKYTVRSVYEEFRDRADFEIILVDNWCAEAENQGRTRDNTWEYFSGQAKRLPWLKLLSYDDHLSHWASKSFAVQHTDARFFLFLDAHVIPGRDALFNAYRFYGLSHEWLNGSLHVPTTYHIMEPRRLQYKLVNELVRGYIGYSFTGYKHSDAPYIVPCHTTDGAIISRRVYQAFGGWPLSMTAWGGGENLFNFTLAVLGKNVWLYPGPPLYHDGAPRGYAYNYDGLHRNRATAMFMIGGADLCRKYMLHVDEGKRRPPSREHMLGMAEEIIRTCRAQREHIKARQVISIQDWAVHFS